MYHCHMLTHEDAGMMGQFIVVDNSTVSVVQNGLLPSDFPIFTSYPNPFNPSTTIRFLMIEKMSISLKIFDIRGNLIQTLLDDNLEKGIHEIQWNGSTNPSGIYFGAIQYGNRIITKKLILLK